MCSTTKSVEDFSMKKGSDGVYRRRSCCKKCHVKSTAIWRKKNPGKLKNLRLKELENNRIRASDYYYDNRYKPEFQAKRCKEAAKRRATKIKATPEWLSEDHIREIDYLYWLSKDISITSGEQYHVDHIIPLKGKGVCGLHVPWNLQVIPSDINLRKSNKHA